MSRSPSVGSRSGSDDEEGVDGERGDTRARYVSRSPSISPDREMAPAKDDDKLEGDV